MFPEAVPGSAPLAETGPETVTTTTSAAAPEGGPVAESEAATSVAPSAEGSDGTGATPVETAETTETSDAAEIGELLTAMPEVSGVPIGQVTQGYVVKVTDDEVVVDIGLKSEGAIPRAEFADEDGQVSVQPGDTVDVLIEEYDEQEGTFTVSHLKAAVLRAWEDLERASNDQTNVTGRVIERTKGGMTVSVNGVNAFLPASQADIRPLRNVDGLIGQEIICKVVKLNRGRNNVVVSRRAALEEENAQRKAELTQQLAEGVELTGHVKNLTSYGAFVDLGGMDGLLHVTDLAWGRVGHPSEVVKVGQELRVKVLKYDPEKDRISLGLKQLVPDPWERVAISYKPGDHLKGRVVSLTDYGAFCEIEPGIEGLIHVSEMTWSRRHKHPSKFVSVGDTVEVSVLEVNSGQRRISLSLRQTLGDPWKTLTERLATGAVVEGRVRNVTDYGAFVEIEDGIEGLIHVSDISWSRSVKHASDVLKKGQKIKAVVLNIDPEQRRIALGLKQLEPDIWQTFVSQTPVGSVVPGKVVRLTQFGAFVELREGVEGLCHVSEMGEEHRQRGKSPLKVGTELPFRVLRASAEEHKIGLSLKELEARVRNGKNAKNGKSGKAEGVATPAQPATSTTMAEKMAQAIKAAAAASAAKRETQAAAQPEQAQPVSNPVDAATEVEVPSAQASAVAVPEAGIDAAMQTKGKEEVPSEPVAAVLQHEEPDRDRGDGAADAAAGAILSEETTGTTPEAAPSDRETVLVGGAGPAVEAVAAASPVASAESAPAEANSSEEILPAGAQS
ncbi:MAG TPA: 30S ribosomal protein S1 [Terriglobia bacterium]|nr:30S ribosomal protein S1 [Terriglobia bacterium]